MGESLKAMHIPCLEQLLTELKHWVTYPARIGEPLSAARRRWRRWLCARGLGEDGMEVNVTPRLGS